MMRPMLAALLVALVASGSADTAFVEAQDDFCKRVEKYGIRCAALTPPSKSRPKLEELRGTVPYVKGDVRIWEKVELLQDELVERMQSDGCLNLKPDGWLEGGMVVISIRCVSR